MIQQTHHKWDAISVQKLIEGVKLYGLDWKRIQQKYFPTLSPLICKNKFYKKSSYQSYGSIKEFVDKTQQSSQNLSKKKCENDQDIRLQQTLAQQISVPTKIPLEIPHFQQEISRPKEMQQSTQQQLLSISNHVYSLPWTRNQSLPITTDMSLIDDTAQNEGQIDNQQLINLLIQASAQPSSGIFSPPMLSPTREKSEPK